MTDLWVVGLMLKSSLGRFGTEDILASYEDELRQVAEEMAGPDPSPSVRLLAETAALDWFALRKCQANFAAPSNDPKGLTMKQSEFQQRRIDRAHKRLMASLRTLAAVRKMAVPVLQVYIAERQLNVATMGATPAIG